MASIHLTVSMNKEEGYRLNGVFCLGSFLRLELRCWLGCILISSSESFTKLSQIICQIQLLVAIRMRSLSSCWMLVGCLSELLEALLRS